MTYRDPDDPRLRTSADPAMSYRDPNEPTYVARARGAGWSAGSVVGAIVVLLLIVGAIGYATNRNSMTSASGPSTTQSAPASTTGQGGSTGTAR